MLRNALASLAVLMATLASIQARADQPMTFTQLLDQHAGYRATWVAMLVGIPPNSREDRFLHTLNGPAAPLLSTNVVGTHLLVGFVCENGRCHDDSITVVIEPATTQMYAVQRRRGDVPLRYRFFGRPDGRMRAVLVRQAVLADLPLDERLRR